MKLRDKTNQRFKDFFLKVYKMHEGKEFELAFSEIQRETGAANTTMKRALDSLEAEGWLQIKPGRNSRYACFNVLSSLPQEPEPKNPPSDNLVEESPDDQPNKTKQETNLELHVIELEGAVESLRRRIRTQEMTIALLQERVAEIEDKLYKR